MFNKSLCFLALSVFIANTFGASTHIESNKSNATRLYYHLKEVIESNITEALEQFKEVEEYGISTGKQCEFAGVLAIDLLREQYLSQVKELEDRANASGIVATNCTNGIEEEITKLHNNLAKSIFDCVESKLQWASNFEADAITAINNTFSRTVSYYDEKLANCSNLDDECYAQLCAKIANDIQSVPLMITEQKDEALNVLNYNLIGMEICTDSIDTDFNRMVYNIIVSVEQCIFALLD